MSTNTHRLPRNAAFATSNTTAMVAVIIDGYIGLYHTQDGADKVWALIGGDNDDLGGTSFGYCEMIRPGMADTKNIYGEITTVADVADYCAINLTNYIAMRRIRERRQHAETMVAGALASRLASTRFFNELFGQ